MALVRMPIVRSPTIAGRTLLLPVADCSDTVSTVERISGETRGAEAAVTFDLAAGIL
jgi:hypothetical protein